MNQFFDNPNFAPKTPIPPVNRTLMKPKIEIRLKVFLLKKSLMKYVIGNASAIKNVTDDKLIMFDSWIDNLK